MKILFLLVKKRGKKKTYLTSSLHEYKYTNNNNTFLYFQYFYPYFKGVKQFLFE